jgi:hypothetical protein
MEEGSEGLQAERPSADGEYVQVFRPEYACLQLDALCPGVVAIDEVGRLFRAHREAASEGRS